MSDTPKAGPAAAAGRLKVGIFTQGRAVVCRLAGDLDLGTLPQAARALENAAARHPWLLAVDLSATRRCDVHCLGYLAGLSRRVPLALVHPSPEVDHALHLAGMDQEMRVFATVEGAAQELERVEGPDSHDGPDGTA